MTLKENILKVAKQNKFKDELVFELEGDYNDADYTYDTYKISIKDPDLKLFCTALKKCLGEYKWNERSEFLNEEEDSILEDISLYGEEECHTMSIDSITFQCSDGKSYNITLDKLIKIL